LSPRDASDASSRARATSWPNGEKGDQGRAFRRAGSCTDDA
jgi:hypothetical protein